MYGLELRLLNGCLGCETDVGEFRVTGHTFDTDAVVYKGGPQPGLLDVSFRAGVLSPAFATLSDANNEVYVAISFPGKPVDVPPGGTFWVNFTLKPKSQQSDSVLVALPMYYPVEPEYGCAMSRTPKYDAFFPVGGVAAPAGVATSYWWLNCEKKGFNVPAPKSRMAQLGDCSVGGVFPWGYACLDWGDSPLNPSKTVFTYIE